MCDRCADIDYPVADIWRPCYLPGARRANARNDDFFETAEMIGDLRGIIRQQHARIAAQQRTVEAMRLSVRAPSVGFDGPPETE